MKGRGEAGQALPLAAVAALGCVLLAVAVTKAVLLFNSRTVLQTSADATALSAATAYARGLNVAAASNDILLGAAGTDLLLKFLGSSAAKAGKAGAKAAGTRAAPASFTEAVMDLQDAWAGTGPTPGGPGIAPAFMQAIAVEMASRNGLTALALWNGRTDPGGLAPDLNLRRCDEMDWVAWATGGDIGNRDSLGRSRISYSRKRTEDEFSYRDRRTGQRVVVPAGQVERKNWLDRRGREEGRWRIRTAPGDKGGRFVKKNRVTKEVMEFFDVPFPLVERTPLHDVLIIALPKESSPLATGGVPAVSRAEVSGGEVFNGICGDADFDVRLSGAGAASPGVSSLLGLLSRPDGWKSWAALSAAGAASGWTAGRLRRMAGRKVPGA